MNQVPGNERSVAEIISDTKSELKQFFETRLQLLKQEGHEKLDRLKVLGILAGAATILLATAYLLITVALSALVAALLITSPYRWVFGFAGIGILWGVLGAVAAYLVKKELKTLEPKRMIEVLKGDTKWLKREINTQI